jgi:Domain of unknown function DUF29
VDQQKSPVITNAALYERDFYAWCLTTADLVRTGQWDAIDQEALIEELESLGKSLKRELENRLEGLVMHLLKWASQPGRRLESHSWYDTIREHRNQIARLLRDSPSLKPQVPLLVEEVYPAARAWALGEMTSYTREKQLRQILQQDPLIQQRALSVDMETFQFSLPPPQCPWTAEQILDTDFWPDTP